MTGTCELHEPRFAGIVADLSFDDVVLYPNPYITVTPKGYTKHYFMGLERIATAIGGGGFCNMVYPVDDLDAREYIDAHFGKNADIAGEIEEKIVDFA